MDFRNTSIAFEYKSNKDLKKAYLLFKTLSKNKFVKLGKYFTNTALKIKFPIKWIVKPTIYSHFVGGETIEECNKIVEILSKYNVKSILDYSVESESTEENISNTLNETLKSIKNASLNKNIPFAVFKPSAFASTLFLEKASSENILNNEETIALQKFEEIIDILCKTGFENKVRILIDAEEYAMQKIVDDVVYKMMEKYNKTSAIVYNTLQMYRNDRIEFMTHAIEKAKSGNYLFGAKLVRGAYMEKERERAKKYGYQSPINENKEKTDTFFNTALKICVDNIDIVNIFCGTHNENSCTYLTELMTSKNIQKNDERIFFSQLYGMSDHISFNMSNAGYNVAKYIPYGKVKYVLPYLIRRAEENTSVAGQTGRELKLISEEMELRKSKQKK